MPYNKYAVKVLAAFIQMPEPAKWILFVLLNGAGVFKMAWTYEKAKKGTDETKDVDIFILTVMAKILFQALCTGFLVSLFGIVSDMPQIRMAETMGMSFLVLAFIPFEWTRKKSLLKRLLKGVWET
ncbi:MAG: hypothetical protein IJN92_08665 [Lachnospiraceae bacterium]|nr:hypothetical protein [Lachnospiraceae bacterium]